MQGPPISNLKSEIFNQLETPDPIPQTLSGLFRPLALILSAALGRARHLAAAASIIAPALARSLLIPFLSVRHF